MIIGRMNWRITLQQNIYTPDVMGGSRSNWTSVAKVWAEFRAPNAKEVTANGRVVSDLVRQVSIRRRTDVCRGWQVIHGTKTWDVLHVFDYDLETTVMMCREVTHNGDRI